MMLVYIEMHISCSRLVKLEQSCEKVYEQRQLPTMKTGCPNLRELDVSGYSDITSLAKTLKDLPTSISLHINQCRKGQLDITSERIRTLVLEYSDLEKIEMALPAFLCVRVGVLSAQELMVSSMQTLTKESLGPLQWPGEKAKKLFGGASQGLVSPLRLSVSQHKEVLQITQGKQTFNLT